MALRENRKCQSRSSCENFNLTGTFFFNNDTAIFRAEITPTLVKYSRNSFFNDRRDFRGT